MKGVELAFAFRIQALVLALLFVTGCGHDEATDPIRKNYAKKEYRIPMRDGTRLFTSVYTPKDRSTRYPILVTRTPYGVQPYGEDSYPSTLGPVPEFAAEGFIFVKQDVRGRFLSEGEFVNMRPHLEEKDEVTDIDESTDTYDTIEWLLENVRGHNEKVGLWGTSYPGFYAAAGAVDSHPALKAVCPQAPIADWYWDDLHHHGAVALSLSFNFLASFGVKRTRPTTKGGPRFDHGTTDGYEFFLELGPLKNVNERHFRGEIEFWNEMAAHPDYDEFWQSRNILPHLDDITSAVAVVGGWFDADDLYGSLRTYRAIEEQNPDIYNVLVMGPWSHGGWARGDGRFLGEADFGSATSQVYRDSVVLPFFRWFLKGEGKLDLPKALVFETGANRWRRLDAWPPAELQVRRLYLRTEGGLSFDPPTAPQTEFDAWVSDPNDPVPYTERVTVRRKHEFMTEDQRFAHRRHDVLTYQTDELEEDLTLAGALTADLWVSTSGTDSDWIVKIIDVLPDRTRTDEAPRQRLIRAEAFRGRYRESYEHPEPFEPNQPTPVSFELLDILHTFQRGHRVMVQIQSTWFPLIDRNPQKFVSNIFESDADDFTAVTNRVYRCSKFPTSIQVGVLSDFPAVRGIDASTGRH